MRFIALDVSVEFVLIYRPHPVDQEPTFVRNVQMTVMKNQTADNITTGRPLSAQYATADTTLETNVN